MSANERGDERMLRDTFDETLEHHILPKSLARPMLSLNLYMDYFRYYHNMFEKPIQVGLSVQFDILQLHGSREALFCSVLFVI
jgi:hypothetical protein